mgnify:CR=1 FL=1
MLSKIYHNVVDFVIVRLCCVLRAGLYELEQELKAVHNMYMLGYISNSLQLCKLDHTIVGETESMKPQIRTKSARSVQRFESTIRKDTHIKVR